MPSVPVETKMRVAAMKHLRLLLLGLLALGALLLAGHSVPALAASFTVDSTADAVDANPGDGVCLAVSPPQPGSCTLRAAIQEPNALAGADTITVPAGSYTLAIPGLGEDFSATGDLDILDDVAIIGAGADVTMLSQPMALAGGASLGCAGHVPLMLCELAEAL